MTLQELLLARRLTSALIVDDAYDLVPRAEDLVDEGAWSTFMDDVGEDADHLKEAFPAFETMDAISLQTSDEFVASVWKLRDKLRPELWKPLFEPYEQGTQSDREFLAVLEARLTAIGVTSVRAGRTIPPAGHSARLVFVDLFLGAPQLDRDMERSVARLRELMKGRESDPPLVILMSRSTRLSEKKAYFRDSAQLVGTMFRVHSKAELIDGQTLERTLDRLARHHADAVRVAALLSAWDKGLKTAADRFLRGMRRLDLPDYAQIRQVLLDYEGQPIGSYVLDVFDRVLQHEVEADAATIAAAEALNSINAEDYPAPYIAGTPDLQDLVYRSIWQHPSRLGVRTTESGMPVNFGDVLVRQSLLRGEAPNGGEQLPADVLVVMTPPCDLIRKDGCTRVLMMAGTLADLDHRSWVYTGSAKTPIIVLPDGRRMWIQWNPKDTQALLQSEISALLIENGMYRITHRLRDNYALELQQRLLADLGRVGTIAKMPATFAVSVTAYTASTAGELASIALPTVAREGGVCFTGRDDRGRENTRLVLAEEAIDELLTALSKIDEDTIHERSREALRRLKASTSFAVELQHGIRVPGADQKSFVPIKVLADVGGAPTEEIVGLIARNPGSDEKIGANIRHAAVILILKSVDPDGTQGTVAANLPDDEIEHPPPA